VSGPDLERWLALRSREGRDALDAYAISGARLVIAAADHGNELEALLVSPPRLRSVAAQMVVRRLRARGVPVTKVDPATLSSLFPDRDPQGVAAIVRRPIGGAASIGGSRALWLAVESVRSPGNLGSALRTSAAVGASGVVALRRGAKPALDLRSPDVVRASMGAIASLHLASCTASELRARAVACGMTVVGASPEARIDYRELDWSRSLVLVVGAERGGLSHEQRAICDALVHIPMRARIDSLNFAVATSVLLYEAYRARAPAVSGAGCRRGRRRRGLLG
jgi:TrmH family RNA methyltransferase